MKYGYVLLERAQQEYESSVKWYAERSMVAPEKFVAAVDDAITLICNNPYWWRNQYKNFYELSLKRFPFTVIYVIEEEKKLVVITSIFHTKRKPSKKYRITKR